MSTKTWTWLKDKQIWFAIANMIFVIYNLRFIKQFWKKRFMCKISIQNLKDITDTDFAFHL